MSRRDQGPPVATPAVPAVDAKAEADAEEAAILAELEAEAAAAKVKPPKDEKPPKEPPAPPTTTFTRCRVTHGTFKHNEREFLMGDVCDVPNEVLAILPPSARGVLTPVE